jgi:hypothetical protein
MLTQKRCHQHEWECFPIKNYKTQYIRDNNKNSLLILARTNEQSLLFLCSKISINFFFATKNQYQRVLLLLL